MRPIQFVLIPLFGFLLILFWIRLKGQPLLRLLVGSVLGLAIVFTVFPDSSTWLAQKLGVGRGVDMVIYLGMTGLMAACLWLYLRIQQLEQKLIRLSRDRAMEHAKSPSKSP